MPGMPIHWHLEQLPDGQWVIIDDDTGNIVPTDPYTGLPSGDEIPRESNPPAINTTKPAAPSSSGPSALSGTEPFLPAALKWLGAVVLLWIILTALSEHGDPNARTIGRALAGLILLGALFYLGPGAISNVQNLWTQAGNPNPVLGPNPVPGA